MLRELVLAPEAFDDLRSAYRWYEERRSGLGLAFEHAIGSRDVAHPAVTRRPP